MRKNLLSMPSMILIIFCLLSLNMIEITVAQADHDIAIVSVTPSSTSVILGELLNISVVVENKGTNNETFDITVYYDDNSIKTETVQNLTAGTNTSLTFTWNTTNTREEIYATTKKEKTYEINATATISSDENPNDNTLVSEDRVRVISQYIAVIPQSTVDPTLTPGKNYTVSIYTDYNGTDIWSWEFGLAYNPNVLEGIEVTNGDLITTEKHPDAAFQLGTFNNTAGKLLLPAAYIYYASPPAPTTFGPGTLAYVTFQVKAQGDSNITIVEDLTQLRNPQTGFPGIIINYYLPSLGHIRYGYFRNTEEEVIHDIAVESVAPSLTSVVAGEPVNITVVVRNKGTVAETFDVKVYYDYMPAYPTTNLVGTQTVTNLKNGTSTTLTLTWNTTDIRAGNYTMTALVEPLSGETYKEDNKLDSTETVTVKVRPRTPLPIEPIAGGVVAVIAVVVVVYAVRRRKKPIPE